MTASSWCRSRWRVEVALHAKEVLLADMRARRKKYEALGMKPDSSVDYEAIEQYYDGV